MSIVTILKVGVSEQPNNDGNIFLVVFAARLFVHLISFLYLVTFNRKYRVVIKNSPLWLLLVTLSVGALHVWFMLWAAAPSPTICTAQLATGLASGALFVITVATKALHYQFIHENAVLCDAFGSSATSHRMISTVFGAALTVIEAGIACAWVLNPATAVSSTMSISLPINGSYWHYTTAWVHPASVAYASVNALALLATLVWAFTSAVAAVTVTLASFGLIGYKVVAIHWRTTGPTGVQAFADKSRVSELASVSSSKQAPSGGGAASMARRWVRGDADLCILEQTSALVSSLVPERVQSVGRLAPWRLCEVEVARDYQYLTLMTFNGSATATAKYFALPCSSVTADSTAWIVMATFKSGAVLEIQARNATNLGEWLRVVDVGPDMSMLAEHSPKKRGTGQGAVGAPDRRNTRRD
ncbi:hypothetical protein AMAG_04914 [Allomyces macrogynus ATCC 38327]|uniref:Uncharacterized protein n=1 Tax=Allomyces macrogynus (strain ATCC 38327) TaxID=578462 RepID=A0A0L0S6Z1_ALLM3|nr:hypothetical protein AMAG_04914 [Allomyces macrogynus ATCC 38327]|eukprot:KNE58094.1 hypothetical protein AMAG_04914 [Allomyces macrogynus ATCC 38327]